MLSCLLLITTIGVASAADDCYYTTVDLTYPVSKSTNCFPNFLRFEFISRVIEDTFFVEDTYRAGDEGGTKVEVPGRFCEDGYTVGQLCKDKLFLLRACVIDLAAKAAMDDNYQATVQDVEEWQACYGKFPPRSIVIFDFGWSPRCAEEDRFFGCRGPLGTQLNHPGLCPELADYLGRSCDVYAVGTDAPDVDNGRNNELTISPSQRVLALHGTYTVTQLQLQQNSLPAVGATVTVAPFFLCDATCAPARVYAEYCIDPEPEVECPLLYTGRPPTTVVGKYY